MGEEFALDHWRSRAIVAEKERDSARSVLAQFRTCFRVLEEDPGPHRMTELLADARLRMREHDRDWWTRDHALYAFVEAISGVSEEDELRIRVRGVLRDIRAEFEAIDPLPFVDEPTPGAATPPAGVVFPSLIRHRFARVFDQAEQNGLPHEVRIAIEVFTIETFVVGERRVLVELEPKRGAA